MPTLERQSKIRLANLLHRILLIRFVHLLWHYCSDKGIEAVEVRITAVTLIHQYTIDGLPMALQIEQWFVAIHFFHQECYAVADTLIQLPALMMGWV